MGCTSALCTGLRADRQDWLGGARTVVPGKVGGEGSGQACGVAIVASRRVWNQHVRSNTVEVCCIIAEVIAESIFLLSSWLNVLFYVPCSDDRSYWHNGQLRHIIVVHRAGKNVCVTLTLVVQRGDKFTKAQY